MKSSAFLGLRTTIYPVADVDRAKRWYTDALGKPPYFDQPYYVGFNVGGFELGLVPRGPNSPDAAVTYWGVPAMAKAWEDLIAKGAAAVSQPRDVGEGILVATLKDPFGNLVGLIENPHFPNQEG